MAKAQETLERLTDHEKDMLGSDAVSKVNALAERIAELEKNSFDPRIIEGAGQVWHADKAADALFRSSAEFEEFLKVLAMECPFAEDEFVNTKREDLEERAFQTAMAAFKRKIDRIQSVAWPVIKEVEETQGNVYENIMVPITDGKGVYQIPCNLHEAYRTEGKDVVKQFERIVMLHIIDDCWKENLRQLDELRHSVQNASYEQKDPLLIFKLESAKLFDSMVDDMNNRIASILTRGQIPEMQHEDVQEAREEREPERHYEEHKDDLTDVAQQQAAQQDTREEQPRQPYVADKLPGRNDPCPCGSGKKFKNCHGRGLV